MGERSLALAGPRPGVHVSRRPPCERRIRVPEASVLVLREAADAWSQLWQRKKVLCALELRSNHWPIAVPLDKSATVYCRTLRVGPEESNLAQWPQLLLTAPQN